MEWDDRSGPQGGTVGCSFGPDEQHSELNVIWLGAGGKEAFVSFAVGGDEQVLDKAGIEVDAGGKADVFGGFVEDNRADLEASVPQRLEGRRRGRISDSGEGEESENESSKAAAGQHRPHEAHWRGGRQGKSRGGFDFAFARKRIDWLSLEL